MTLDEIIAREEIRDCILRHFRAADRCDADLERRAFWPDARFVGGPVEGRMDEVIPRLFEELLPNAFDGTCHYAGNILVTVDGATARAECYAIGLHFLPDDAAVVAGLLGERALAGAPGQEMLVGVRYAIALERRGDEWRMSAMQPIVDWARVIPASGDVEAIPFVRGIEGRGRRGRGDPSYFGGNWQP